MEFPRGMLQGHTREEPHSKAGHYVIVNH